MGVNQLKWLHHRICNHQYGNKTHHFMGVSWGCSGIELVDMNSLVESLLYWIGNFANKHRVCNQPQYTTRTVYSRCSGVWMRFIEPRTCYGCLRIVTPRRPCCGKRNDHQILGYPFSVVMSCGFLEVCLNMSPPETLQPCDNLVNKPVAKIYVGLFCDHTIYAFT